MSTDISGCWVEFRCIAPNDVFDEEWCSVIDAGCILDQSYSMFGSLFGVRNSTNFVPVAAGRGLPPNVSEEVRKSAEQEDNHSHTWVSWNELWAVDWEESELDGTARSAAVGETGLRSGRYLARDDPRRHDGAAWSEDGMQLSVKRVTRREAAGDSFRLLMEMTEPLARRYGGQRVRLVVWFSN